MATPFRFKNADGTTVDFEDYYVRADYFSDDYFKRGGLWLWGFNGYSQIGDNTTTTRSSPVQTVTFGSNWKQVFSLKYNTIALKKDGTLWGWGVNGGPIYGNIGDNTNTPRSSPVQTVAYGTDWKSVSSNSTSNSVVAIKTDGTLWAWGSNGVGQLGDNTIISKSSPVQMVSRGTNWMQADCGRLVTAAIKTDGTLWMCGAGGSLGDNTTISKSSPVQTVAGGTNWKQVSCGSNHTAAIKTDGTLWVWGSQSLYGYLGDNTLTSRSSPVQTVAGGTNWKQVSCGYSHTAAIKTDGTLWVWGRNDSGKLGFWNLGDAGTSPVTVSGSKTTASTFTTSNTSGVSVGMKVYTSTVAVNWTTVSAINPNVSITFTPTGPAGTWTGTISLGVNAIKPSMPNAVSSPVQTIAFGTNWKQVSCGFANTAAIKTDGTLWLWGSNSYGRIGDNTTTNRSSPVQTIMYGTNWKQVCCGYRGVTAAIQYQDDYQ